MRKAPAFICVFALMVLTVVSAEKKLKLWTQWNEKDAQKILTNSPWGQTQVEMNISEMTYSPTTRSQAGRATSGALNQSVPVSFRIRLLSAKPVRQAFMRAILLAQKQPNPQLEASLKSFVERDFSDFIVVAVDYESDDRRLLGPVQQSFESATADLLRNNTYLETQGGKRTFLLNYQPPAADGLGAKFIFPRKADGQLLITSDTPELRFYSEVGTVKLNMRFKVADFLYDGTLEY